MKQPDIEGTEAVVRFDALMRKVLSVSVGLLLVLIGCKGIPKTGSSNTQKTLPPDKFEILAWHLLRRSREANSEIVRLEGEITKHDNECLREELAILEGRAAKPRGKADNQLAKSIDRDLGRMVQGLLDAEEAIEEHNRRHPEHSMADVKYMLHQFCGDCTRERATRDSELKEEAQKYTLPNDTRFEQSKH